MKKTEFLGTQLLYELKFKNKNEDSIEQLSGVDTYITANWTMPQYSDGTLCVYSSIDYSSIWSIDEITPIIRPLDSLVKECVQADYNDGKPFVPIEELRECAICDADYMWLSAIEDDLASVDEKLQVAPFHLIILLLKFHFWPNMPEGEEVVWVTDEFNPYK